ncbi:MAG: ABC transporter permease, partial [Bacteroidales bacterium]
MLSRIANKVLYSFLVIWGVVTVIFILFNILPGDPARMMLGQRADMQTVEFIREELGLNEPLYKQYFRYVNDLSPLSIHNIKDEESFFYLNRNKYQNAKILVRIGNENGFVVKQPYLGKSFQNNRGVGEMISEALPNSLILAFTAILIAFIIGNLVGVFAALKKDTWMDRLSIFISTLGMSLP